MVLTLYPGYTGAQRFYLGQRSMVEKKYVEYQEVGAENKEELKRIREQLREDLP